jgi:excinuclease UvrABC ATPase subunit
VIEDVAEILYEFKKDAMSQVFISIKTLKGEYPEEWQRERRIDYLKTCMEDVIFDTFYLMNDYEELQKGNDSYSRMYVGSRIVEKVESILELQNNIIHLRTPGRKNGKGRIITDDMIERAREYPFDQLVEVTRNKMAVCPFHGDKDPSFSIKNNYGWCFGCQWHGNAIDFVMERDGLKFADAVRRLQ